MSVAQSEVVALVGSLNRTALEIKSFDNEDYSELVDIGNILKDKKIIGLGEGTHGTREFYLYKAKLIKFLITHHRLRSVLIESNMAGLQKVNDFLLNRSTADTKTIIERSSLFSIYRTEEVADLLRWIKNFNLGKPLSETVRFQGIDMHYTDHIINDILQNKELTALLNSEEQKALTDLKKRWQIAWKTGEPKLTKQEKDRYLKIAAKLSGKRNFGTPAVYKQYSRLLRQSILFNNLPDIKANRLRDEFMAENIIAAVAESRQDDKVVVWAHNGHVSSGRWRGYKAMGMHLRKRYKEKYYSLGLDVGEGYARLWDPSGNKAFHKSPLPPIVNVNALEYIFKQLQYRNFFLNFRGDSLDESLKKLLRKPLYMRAVGATSVKSEDNILLEINLKKSFDGIVFFLKTTNAAEIL